MSDPALRQPDTLVTRQLTLGYDGLVVVRELNVAIPSGRITALVGRNGSGKSTLLRALARLLKPRFGSVYLDGASIFKLSTKEVARRLGILPQGPVAPEGLTVRELVAQGRYPHQSWLRQWSTQDERAVEHALAVTGMAELAERPLETLSGGQRQKAWIAMALAQETSVMLLDEPTTFLDLAHQMEVLDLLADLALSQAQGERGGRAIVLVLHDLNQAARYAHHLVAIKDGRVFAQGIPADVISEAMVDSVFGLECRVIEDPIAGTPLCIPVSRHRPTPHRADDASGVRG
ncbi:MAG: ATP-binding cassette domain-containing protein [Chloroflexi bacterium]|nr:ATP-binding cassette domain-containing protein [Chloroflexota bacterium]